MNSLVDDARKEPRFCYAKTDTCTNELRITNADESELHFEHTNG
jgi:hypothetical protein